METRKVLLLYIISFLSVLANPVVMNGEPLILKTSPNKILNIYVEEYNEEGKELIEKIKTGDIELLSFDWDLYNGFCTYKLKTKQEAIVVFSQTGEYLMKYTMRYTYPGSSSKHTYNAEWLIEVTEPEPTAVYVFPIETQIQEGESTECSAVFIGGKSNITWSSYGDNVMLEANGDKCEVYALKKGTAIIRATTENGLSDYVEIEIIKEIIPGEHTADLYLSGEFNNWALEEKYKFTKIDNETDMLCLSKIPEEFKLYTKEWRTMYGRQSTDGNENHLSIDSQVRLVRDGGSIIFDKKETNNVMLIFKRRSKTLQSLQYLDESANHDMIWITTDDKGKIGHPVKEGDLYGFVCKEKTPDNIIDKTLEILYPDSSEGITPMYSEDKHWFFTPPVSSDLAIRYVVKEQSSANSIFYNSNIKVEICNDGLLLSNMTINTIVTIFSIDGMSLGHHECTEDNGIIKIPLTQKGIYIVVISDGKQFKICF